MAGNVEGLIREGVAALKAGRKDEAFEILTRATEVDERNEDAWLWLSAVVDNLENQQICLENVLAINPGNERALQGLNMIQRKLEARQHAALEDAPAVAPPPAPPIEPPPVQPQSASPFDLNAPVAGGSEEQVPVHEEPRGYHGSGQAVEQPSNEQYDDWVSGLNLGSEPNDDVYSAGFDEPESEPVGFDSGDRGTQQQPFDPFAMPASGAVTYEDQPYDAFSELEQMDDDETLFDDAGFDGASPFGAFDDGDETDYRDEQGQIGYLEFLPPDIKPTHLPGQGGAYPRSLLVSLGMLSLGVLAALVVLVLLLV